MIWKSYRYVCSGTLLHFVFVIYALFMYWLFTLNKLVGVCRKRMYSKSPHTLFPFDLFWNSPNFKPKLTLCLARYPNIKCIINHTFKSNFINSINLLNLPVEIDLSHLEICFKDAALLCKSLSKTKRRYNIKRYTFFLKIVQWWNFFLNW